MVARFVVKNDVYTQYLLFNVVPSASQQSDWKAKKAARENIRTNDQDRTKPEPEKETKATPVISAGEELLHDEIFTLLCLYSTYHFYPSLSLALPPPLLRATHTGIPRAILTTYHGFPGIILPSYLCYCLVS